MVKNLPVNAGDMRDVGSNPGSGSSPEDGMTTHSGRIPWTEEPGGYSPWGHTGRTQQKAR